MYGIARVLQESGDTASSRDLLLFLGERSQQLLRAGSANHISNSSTSSASSSRSLGAESGSGGRRPPHEHRLRFPLDAGGGGTALQDRDERPWEGGDGGGAGALVLPAAPTEVMWRVARASMGAKDWTTAILALRGLASEAAAAVGEGGGVAAAAAVPRHQRSMRLYYAGFGSGGAVAASSRFPGPARARVLRALAFCQVQRGRYRDALETVSAVLGVVRAGGGDAAEETDAAMLMLRADALVSGEHTGAAGWVVVVVAGDGSSDPLGWRRFLCRPFLEIFPAAIAARRTRCLQIARYKPTRTCFPRDRG